MLRSATVTAAATSRNAALVASTESASASPRKTPPRLCGTDAASPSAVMEKSSRRGKKNACCDSQYVSTSGVRFSPLNMSTEPLSPGSSTNCASCSCF